MTGYMKYCLVRITPGSPGVALFPGLCGLRREERFAKGYHLSNGEGLKKTVLLLVVENSWLVEGYIVQIHTAQGF